MNDCIVAEYRAACVRKGSYFDWIFPSPDLRYTSDTNSINTYKLKVEQQIGTIASLLSALNMQ